MIRRRSSCNRPISAIAVRLRRTASVGDPKRSVPICKTVSRFLKTSFLLSRQLTLFQYFLISNGLFHLGHLVVMLSANAKFTFRRLPYFDNIVQIHQIRRARPNTTIDSTRIRTTGLENSPFGAGLSSRG